MIRTLLTTTALAALLATGALAQEAVPAPPPLVPAPANPMDVPPAGNGMTENPLFGSPFTLSQGYVPNPGDSLASNLIGSQVYSSAGSDAETIGDVNDLVLDGDGNVAAVVVGVGGFLGVGEKSVAIDYADLQWTTATDGSDRLVLNTSREALTAAPEFVWNGGAGDTAGTLKPSADNAVAAAEQNNIAPNANDTTNISPDLTTDQPQAAADNPDRGAMTPLDDATLTADDIKGIGVFGQNDEQIGTIGDLVVNADGAIDAVIVDVGGFLGVGTKQVAVGFDNLQFAMDATNQRYLFLNTTKQQLEAQPKFDKATYPADRKTQRMVVNP
ncbi:MAG TPA: PRC-barrel domain-containing protein [Devosiaceae bacterium]|jgi:sporulation protein YlmC with PRC-barrel domain